jgi:hypothetical protein
MKYLTICLALIALTFTSTPAPAQSAPPPPAPAPDYSPDKWKEFVYESDNVKVRFPAEPKFTTETKDESFGKMTTRTYHHQSFIALELMVAEYPSNINFEEAMSPKDLLGQMRDGGLAEVKQLDPKVIKDEDISVDGHAAKFLQVETSNGQVIRAKFFVVKNRLYFMYAEVKKGERHGFNYENDFEKVAMGFLDSVKLLQPKQ